MTQHRKSVPQTPKQPESTQACDPTLDEWRRLHDAALRFQELAPWNWMAEADIFGVVDPETGNTGFVSVMGGIGEHFAMSLYLGEEALHDFLAIEYSDESAGHEQILEIPQLMASFVEWDDLENRDRKVLKRLGVSPQGDRAWPQFQSYRPGYWPWFVDGGEARRLAVALEQAAVVVSRFRDDENLLHPEGENQFLVRRRNGDEQWVDEVTHVPPPPPQPFQLFVPGESIEVMKALTGGASIIEMDLFMFPFRVGKKDERPFYSYALMMVEAGSGLVISFVLVQAAPRSAEHFGHVAPFIAKGLKTAGSRPREVRVTRQMLHDLLTPIAKKAGFRLKFVSDLPALDQARKALYASYQN